jgi:hypothetical protein
MRPGWALLAVALMGASASAQRSIFQSCADAQRAQLTMAGDCIKAEFGALARNRRDAAETVTEAIMGTCRTGFEQRMSERFARNPACADFDIELRELADGWFTSMRAAVLNGVVAMRSR